MQTATLKQTRQQQSLIALRTVNKILDKWDCSLEEKLCLLGGMKKSSFYKYLKDDSANIDHDLLERLSYILNIHSALRILLSDPSSVYSWVKKANSAPFYAGRTALEVMLQGNVVDLWNVSSRLNAERGGWT